MVSHVDFLPTMMGMAGLSRDVPKFVQGRDVSAAASARPVLAEFWQDGAGRFSRAYMEGSRKLMVDLDGRAELYDLAADPEESTDLARRLPAGSRGSAGAHAGDVEAFAASRSTNCPTASRRD